MRRARLKAPPGSPTSHYHCLSRVVDRRFIFDTAEKEHFVALMRECEAFCEVRVLTFCVMSNHFHLLVEVPARPRTLPTADQVLAKLSLLSGHQDVGGVRQKLDDFRRRRDSAGEAAFLATFHARMWDLSAFMKLLKQRFSQWYNRRVGRRGTLWEDRFKSVLVEGTGHPLATMAAYIDLNPVRADLVDDPKDYRWSGYGEAAAGVEAARQGIQRIVVARLGGSPELSAQSLSSYRAYLFYQGGSGCETMGADGRSLRGSVSREAALEVLKARGRLSLAAYLRCRVRYFCDGAVFGSREFVEQIFVARRDRFGPRRRDGARRMRGLESDEGLFTVRDLRLRVFE